MTDATSPTTRFVGRYHSDQITAHWTIVFLLVFQFLTGETMAEAMDTSYGTGSLPAAGVLFVHGILGTAILGIMLWRVSLRLRFGAPPPPETEPSVIQKISRAVHFTFYVVLIAMPLAGILAVFTMNETIGTLHALTSKLLIALIAAHILGAVWHVFKGDGIIRRVLSGQPENAEITSSERVR